MSLTGHHAASCQAPLGQAALVGGVTRVQVTAVSPTNQGAGAERRICRSQFTQTCEQAQEAAESSDSLAPPPRVLLRHLQLQSPGAAGWVPPPGSPVHFLCGAACCVNTTGLGPTHGPGGCPQAFQIRLFSVAPGKQLDERLLRSVRLLLGPSQQDLAPECLRHPNLG